MIEEDSEQESVDVSELELRALEERIGRLQTPPKAAEKQFAKGLALVASLGFVLAGCLLAGVTLGGYLAKVTGQPFFQLGGALFGLLTAFFAGAKLLGPLMKSE